MPQLLLNQNKISHLFLLSQIFLNVFLLEYPTYCVNSTVALRDIAHFVRSALFEVGTSAAFS